MRSTDIGVITLHHKLLICKKCWAQMTPRDQPSCKEELEFHRQTRAECGPRDFSSSPGRPKVKDITEGTSIIDNTTSSVFVVIPSMSYK